MHARTASRAAVRSRTVERRARSRRERRSVADESVLVQGLYRSLLRRDADPSGLVAYKRMLDEGASPVDLAYSITGGVEYAHFVAQTPSRGAVAPRDITSTSIS